MYPENKYLFPEGKMLQCEHFIRKSANYVERKIKDYELDYYLEGGRIINVEGILYSIAKGDMIFRKPGQLVTSRGDYNCYALSLDLNGKTDIPREIYIRQRETEEQEECDNPVLTLLPTVFNPYHDIDYIHIFEKLCALAYPHPLDLPLQRGLITELFCLLASDAAREIIAAGHMDNQNSAIVEACAYIKTNYMNNLTIGILSGHVHLSPNYFIKLFKKEIGIPPNEYLIRIRFENARIMLVETNLSIKNIAYMCGFDDAAYFGLSFRNRFGVTPLGYRNSYN